MTSEPHIYSLTGRVLPERTLLSIGRCCLSTQAVDGVPEGELEIEIIRSQIFVRFVSTKTVTNALTLRNLAEDAARMLVDAAGFVEGFGMDVDIIQMAQQSTGEARVFGVDIPATKGLAENEGIRFNDILPLLTKSGGKHLQRALGDLRAAIKSPTDTGFFCYRAIESLKNAHASRLAPTSAKDAWEAFRSTYEIDRERIDEVKGFADSLRHGQYENFRAITDAERASIFRIVWYIVGRYIVRETTPPVVENLPE